MGKSWDPTSKGGRQKWMWVPGMGPVIAGQGWALQKGKEAFAKPKAPEIGTPPPPTDITDKAIQAARRNEEFRKGVGSRRNSFITGPLGDNTTIPVLGKSVITGG